MVFVMLFLQDKPSTVSTDARFLLYPKAPQGVSGWVVPPKEIDETSEGGAKKERAVCNWHRSGFPMASNGRVKGHHSETEFITCYH